MSRSDVDAIKAAAGDYWRYALEARREYLNLLTMTDKEITAIYHEHLRNVLTDYRSGRNQGLIYLLQAIDKDSPAFHGALTERIENAIEKGAAAGINFGQLVTMDYIGEAGMDKAPVVKAFEWQRKQAVAANYARTHKDGLYLSDRIWNTSEEARKAMRSIVQAGVGEDAVHVARALETYVKQGKTATCLLYPNMMQRMEGRVPENLDYNALRLARTELSSAYGAATIGAAQASPAIGKVKWVLSSSHPKTDICNAYASGGKGHGVYDAGKCPPYPAHPNCLCTLQPMPEDLDDFLKKMDEWKKDPSSHPEIEKWHKEHYGRFVKQDKKLPYDDESAIIESTARAKVDTLKREIDRVTREMNMSVNQKYIEKEKELFDLQKRLTAAKVDAAKKGVVLTSKLGEAYGAEDLKAITSKVRAAPENVRIVWNRFEDKMKILDTNLDTAKEPAHYSHMKRGIRLNTQKDKTDMRQKPYKTIFHELGHLIDHFAGRNIFFASRYFQSGAFADTIRKEAKDYATAVKVKLQMDGMKQGINPKHYRIADAYDEISRELRGITGTEQREVSDIWDGATKGKASGRYGHKKKYWDDEDSLPTEAFAHMFCATIQNPEALKNIQKYFPNSYAVFLDMMAFIAKKGVL
jgi:hypothetical protein